VTLSMTAESDNDSHQGANNANLAEMAAAATQLDVRGLSCPMPLLKAKQALNKLEAGARLQVQATDPGSVRDFEVFARQSGHTLLSSEVTASDPEVFVYLLQKKLG
jgi:tRNA 2-thiouridine synthesizing protein A